MADQLKMKTPNGVSENISWIAERFPNCVTETTDSATGKLKLSVDFDQLRQELSENVVEGRDERYQFVWPDKRKAILLANSPINATLRPCREESVDFDNTQNLYIEGDNLDVLKCLKETYMGKVKMVYIDPPYNTGNDFVYNDDFTESANEYLTNSGQYDELGNRLFVNTESNGRFHTDWLNMIYPRLKVSRDLLSNDGLIMISIDHNEINNLVKVCDDIFGEDNHIANISVINNPRGRQSDSFFATVNEYLVCYSKHKSSCKIYGQPLTEEQLKDYSLSDENGRYRLLGLRQRGVASLREDRPEMFFPLYVNPETEEISMEEQPGWNVVIPKKSDGREGRWMWGKKKCKEDHQRLVARLIRTRNEYDIFVKDYYTEDKTRKYNTVWDNKEYNNQNGTQEVKALLKGDYMSFPKSRALIETICSLGASKDSLILDFFSGSATTAHAVMQLNSSDSGSRKFIMVQLPEPIDEKNAAYKAGYRTICDLGKERIRQAGTNLRNAGDTRTDVGFRVLKLDSSNMLDVYYAPSSVSQEQLSLFTNNVKDGRSSEDLLFQVMLELGATLDSKIEKSVVTGKEIFNVADGYLVACFDDDVNDEAVKAIAKMQPQYAVLRDSSLANDSTATNFEQIFKTFSPSTTCKIL